MLERQDSLPRPLAACVYRRWSGPEADGVVSCELLQQLSHVKDASLCRVGRDACAACGRSMPPTGDKLNPVIASFLYRLASAVIEAEGRPDCTVEEALELQARAFAALKRSAGSRSQGQPRTCSVAADAFTRTGRTYACDVVLCCSDSSPETERALRSVLNQQSALTLVHLVDHGGGGRELVERYASCGTVTVHHTPVPRSPLATVHDLIDRLHSEYIAIQDPRTVSRPFRISHSVGLLEERGGEILGAGLRTARGEVHAVAPAASYARYLPLETLVIRRAAFVDLGGVADRPGDEDAELVHRAFREKRSLLLTPTVTVEAQTAYPAPPLGPPPVHEPRRGLLRHAARDFPMRRVACDVVLPFWGQLDHVRQAMESLLAQQDADLVIHLIDDATPEDTDAFLRHWAAYPQVRTYRNVRNLSQFTSFNNVAPYFETDLVAVHDGDDVSLPQRIHFAGNALRLSGADIFGSAVVIQHGSEPVVEVGWNELPADMFISQEADMCISSWPTPEVFWFVFNPSMVLRTDVFRVLGGFGDFGGNVRNRTGHDIEFCLRAYHHGMRFALSRHPTVRYRQHPDQTTRSPLTGFGSDAEGWTSHEARRRGALYRRNRFDPVAFGALGKYAGLTQRFVP